MEQSTNLISPSIAEKIVVEFLGNTDDISTSSPPMAAESHLRVAQVEAANYCPTYSIILIADKIVDNFLRNADIQSGHLPWFPFAICIYASYK